MDGLTISNSDNLIERGQTLKEARANRINSEFSAGSEVDSADGAKSFADTLKDAVENVNQTQKEADVQMQKLATGKAESIPDVMIAAEKADIALRLMLQVRNKVIDAYQEIMKMQV